MFFIPISSALVTLFLLQLMLSSGIASKAQDMPNERSLHTIPVPRIGGVGLMAGMLTGWLLLIEILEWWVVLPLLVLFAVSLFDDLSGMSVKQRLLVHLIAAAIMVVGSNFLATHGLIIAILALALTVWMTNLYNFMDGSNGLAGGMTLIGFGMYGIAALLADNSALALLNFCIAAAAGSFLYYNFHPAKIFMGDSGSIPLGFLAATMGLWGWQQGSWGAWFPLLVFSPFIVDASVTLLKRALRGARVTEAHREHYYQRLIQMGWGHRNVALVEYVLMLAVGASALLVRHNLFPWPLFLAWGVIYACLMWVLDMRWKSFKRGMHV